MNGSFCPSIMMFYSTDGKYFTHQMGVAWCKRTWGDVCGSHQGGFAKPWLPDYHQVQLEAFLHCFPANLDEGSFSIRRLLGTCSGRRPKPTAEEEGWQIWEITEEEGGCKLSIVLVKVASAVACFELQEWIHYTLPWCCTTLHCTWHSTWHCAWHCTWHCTWYCTW